MPKIVFLRFWAGGKATLFTFESFCACLTNQVNERLRIKLQRALIKCVPLKGV